MELANLTRFASTIIKFEFPPRFQCKIQTGFSNWDRDYSEPFLRQFTLHSLNALPVTLFSRTRLSRIPRLLAVLTCNLPSRYALPLRGSPQPHDSFIIIYLHSSPVLQLVHGDVDDGAYQRDFLHHHGRRLLPLVSENEAKVLSARCLMSISPVLARHALEANPCRRRNSAGTGLAVMNG